MGDYPTPERKKIMNLMKQVKLEEDNLCYMNFKVQEDGGLDYDIGLWKIVEPKLRVGWAQSHMFDVLCQVKFDENGWIIEFSLQVTKNVPSRILKQRLLELTVECCEEDVVTELGGVVNKNLTDVIADISAGYIPRIFEEIENLPFIQLEIDEAYAQIHLKRCELEFEMAKNKLKEAQKKIEEYKKNGGNYYGKKEKNN